MIELNQKEKKMIIVAIVAATSLMAAKYGIDLKSEVQNANEIIQESEEIVETITD